MPYSHRSNPGQKGKTTIGIRLRRAEQKDLANWALAANAFYWQHNFWQPVSVNLFEMWLSPGTEGIKRTLYLAEDEAGRM